MINALKDGSSVRLTVDGDTREQIRESQLTSADVNAPLYVGGLPGTVHGFSNIVIV